MKVAAIFVLGFALHFFLNWQKTTHHELQHQIHVPTGQHVEIMLADGSKVWLNSGSTLTFPSKFNGKKRLVELDGEGFFEVKSDKEHPFIVSTSKYQVKAVGTSFNIYDYQDSPQFEAALLNGKVEVTTNAKKSSVVILTPNQRAALCQGVYWRLNRLKMLIIICGAKEYSISTNLYWKCLTNCKNTMILNSKSEILL